MECPAPPNIKPLNIYMETCYSTQKYFTKNSSLGRTLPNFCDWGHPTRSSVPFCGENLNYVIVLMAFGKHQGSLTIFIPRFQFDFTLVGNHKSSIKTECWFFFFPTMIKFRKSTFSHKILTQLTFPDRQARWSGVDPKLSAFCKSTPAYISKRIRSGWPAQLRNKHVTFAGKRKQEIVCCSRDLPL